MRRCDMEKNMGKKGSAAEEVPRKGMTECPRTRNEAMLTRRKMYVDVPTACVRGLETEVPRQRLEGRT